MILLTAIRLLFLVVACASQYRNIKMPSMYEENCNKLTLEPYFENEMVLGKRWRIYYSWNMKWEEKCMDMVFTNATQEIVARIFHDMYEYVETQPNWEAATLLMSMGLSNHEMLLFADQGAAGRFVGLPNVVKDGNISPIKRAIPLFNISLKVFSDGKYLVLADCDIGVSTLSASDSPLSRQDIIRVIRDLDLGTGHHACITDIRYEDEANEISDTDS